MKKLFLLLATGFAISSAMAQDNSRVIQSNPNLNVNAKLAEIKNHPIGTYTPKSKTQLTFDQRTTSTGYSYGAWFDYFDANYVSSTGVAYYFEIYPDSNLYSAADAAAGGSGYFFWHGIGMSFDPVDNGYYGPNGVTVGTPVDNTMAYAVDSFQLLDKYIMNNPSAVGDSEIIDLVVVDGASGDGTYFFQFSPSSVGANTICATNDTPHCVNADYMPSNFSSANYANECSDSITTAKRHYAFALNASVAADTDANGYHVTDFGLGDTLQVPAGMKVVAYVTFKSSVNYTLGTPIASANYLHLFDGDPTGAWPVQSPAGSCQIGLVAQNQVSYGYDVYAGHDLLFAPYDFFNPAPPATPYGLEVPLFQFHLLWPGITTSVNNIKNITSVNASPNPASDVVTINYTLAASSDVNVSLTNMMGQVIATQKVAGTSNGNVQFSTTALPDGVYIYTLNANGERSTGRIVVAH